MVLPQPQMQAVLDRLAAQRAGVPSRYEMPFPQARAQLLLEREPWLADGPACAGSDLIVQTDGRRFTMRVVRPAAASPQRLLIYLHGGGWCVGSSRTHDPIVRRLAGGLGCEAWSIDYALAPEAPFPEGLLDVVAAIELAMREHPDARLIVAGDSAGANLALDATLRLRGRGCGRVGALLLFYGVYTDTCTGASMAAYGDGRYGLSIRAHRRYLDACWGSESAAPGTARPTFALAPQAALDGLPPVWLTVAELDILRDQSHALARRLRAAQVPVQIDEVPGVIHGFLAYGQMLDAAGEALARAAAWAGRTVSAAPPRRAE